MRKIRGFKLSLRPKEIQRRAKKAKLDPAQAGLAGEAELTDFVSKFCAEARPSVLYESFAAGSDSAHRVSRTSRNLSGTAGLRSAASSKAGMSAGSIEWRISLHPLESVFGFQVIRFPHSAISAAASVAVSRLRSPADDDWRFAALATRSSPITVLLRVVVGLEGGVVSRLGRIRLCAPTRNAMGIPTRRIVIGMMR